MNNPAEPMRRLIDATRGALSRPREAAERYLGQLQPRERRLVVGAAMVTALLVAWIAIVEPIRDAVERIDRSVTLARRDAASIGELVGRYRRLKAEVAGLERGLDAGDASVSAFAQLESIAVPIAGREHITAMNPSSRAVGDKLQEETVEMRIEGIPMRSLVSLLYAIEQRDRPMHLVRVSFKRQYKNPELLDATLVVARLRAS